MTIQNGLPSIVKSVQQGTVTIPPSVASGTATITAVNTAKSQVDFLGNDKGGQATGAWLQLTNGTTVTATRSFTDANPVTVAYRIIEYV